MPADMPMAPSRRVVQTCLLGYLVPELPLPSVIAIAHRATDRRAARVTAA